MQERNDKPGGDRRDEGKRPQDTPRAPGGARMQPGGEDWGDVDQGPSSRADTETGLASQTADAPLHGAAGDKARTRIDTEDEVAEASDESFPASDPPAFNPGKA